MARFQRMKQFLIDEPCPCDHCRTREFCSVTAMECQAFQEYCQYGTWKRGNVADFSSQKTFELEDLLV